MANFLYAQTTPLFLLSRLGSLNPHFDMSRYLEKFGRLETNLDRVNFVYKDLRKFKLFPKSVKCGKSDAESQGLRERGNEAFGEGGYRLALERYTASLAAAKGPGFLALAFANRSACLYKLGRFQECLTDIERAFANNYPERLKPKLIERRKNAEKLLASSKPPQPYHEDTPEFAEFEKHPKIQCAKNCVEIKRNDEFGRHVVATRDITIGEILCVENPYAIILTDDPLIHCAMCLELCYNTIPCDNCLFLLFCSEECKNKANSTFHKYECPILASLVDCGIRDTELVALRVAISARGDYESLSSPNPNVDEEEVYCSNRYKEIHNLMPATDKQDVNDLFEQAVTAALMYHFLRGLTDFFNNDDMKRVFKEVVLLQIQIVDLNQRGLDEKRKLCDSETENFAIGIYAFTSLFNHSCCPNVEQTMYGSAMVLRSVNTIKKDQQCFISYGLTYGHTPRVLRQKVLKECYFFDCRCMACRKNWHPSDDLIPFKYPLYMDLKMTATEAMIMEMELNCHDVSAAKKYLPHLIRQLQRCEDFEPWGNALNLKRLIVKCYYILGNKKVF